MCDFPITLHAAFSPVWDALNTFFWPAVFEGSISETEKRLFTLPTRMGGMGIRNPIETANNAYETSRIGTSVIVDAIKGKVPFSMLDHNDQFAKTISSMHNIRHQDQATQDSILSILDAKKKRAFRRSIDGKTSAWLAVLPLCTHHFDVSATEFRDALAMRYQRPLLRMPATCDGCGAAFNLEHALDCRKGGLVIQRHNEIRDALGDLASIAFRNVIKEPVVKEANIRDGTPALIADISIRGLWEPQAVALLDVRVVDTDAPSHIHRNTVAVLCSAEEEKKRKYNSAAEACRASFTPFVVSTDGMLGREANFLLKRLAQSISIKWEKPLGQTTGWLRAKLSFAILRATNLCLRGSRIKWRSGVGIDDGAGLPAELPKLD